MQGAYNRRSVLFAQETYQQYIDNEINKMSNLFINVEIGTTNPVNRAADMLHQYLNFGNAEYFLCKKVNKQVGGKFSEFVRH